LGYDIFLRISILDEQVAGVARHLHGRNLPLSAFADSDHFRDITEMIGHFAPTFEAGLLGFLNYCLEIVTL